MQTPTIAYDYRRRSPPYHSRRSASPPPRYRRPSPGRREEGRFSPRRPPPRDGDREGKPVHHRSRSCSQTRSRTPQPPVPQVEVQPAEPTSEVPVSAPIEGTEISRKHPSPRDQKSLNQPGEHSEQVQKSSTPIDTAPESTVDIDVPMADVHVQPPTQPKAFAVSTAAPPTQPKNFNRLPPTGPRSVPTPPRPPHLPHQPPMPEKPSTPVPTRPDPGPTTAGAPIEEEPEIKLPKIQEFTLPDPRGSQRGNQPQPEDSPFTKLDKTVNHTESYVISYF